MRKSFSSLLVSIFLCNQLQASMFGEETVVLIEIATTTASQLNELEKLVSNAEKYTQSIQKYNELFQDQYWRAQQILFVSESLAAKKEAKDLGELNWAVRELKHSMAELKSLMDEYKEIKNDEDRTKYMVGKQKKINLQKSKIAINQVKSAKTAKTSGRANQVTAQNTALLYEQNVEMHNTQLEMLEKVSTTNRLLAEQLEEERLKQIEKEKSYGVNK